MDKNKEEKMVSKKEMTILCNHIEAYLDLYLNVFVIPKNLMYRAGEVEHAIKITKKLIKKLRKGDSSVFRDPDEWSSIS